MLYNNKCLPCENKENRKEEPKQEKIHYSSELHQLAVLVKKGVTGLGF